jgi:7-carboxy-7-deazaguanine synthase (Cx14CxxC type)
VTYTIKEMYFTLQGEGYNTGRPAVFCRFAGCNLWTGREQDRAAATCSFCDTDFVGINGVGGGKFRTAQELADAVVAEASASASATRFVVFTGGEPLLQLDAAVVDALHARGLTLAIETNGTLRAPAEIDWICVSPKAGARLVQRSGDELKLVYPQADLAPAQLEDLDFDHFFLQPMDGPEVARNIAGAMSYCAEHPRWRVSFQTHKFLGIP